MAETAPRYRFGPLERRGTVAGLPPTQVGGLAGSLLAALVALRAVPGSAGAALAVTVAVAGAAASVVPVAGRTAVDWLPCAARWASGWRPRGRAWMTPAPWEGRSRTAVPPAFVGCSVVADPSARGRALVVDRRHGLVGAVVAVRGAGFALADQADKERRVAAWASVLAGLAGEGSALRRVQWVKRTVPTRAGDGSGPTHRVYLFVGVGLRRSRAVRAAGGGVGGAAAVLAREIAALEAQLGGADLTVEGVLGRAALGACLADGFAPGGPPGAGWPQAVEEAWGWLRADGWYHATYWVAEWPRSDVGPDFMAPLILAGTGARAVSVVMEPVAPARAVRQAEAARTAGAADDELRRRAGFLHTARLARQREGTARREAELADGHGEFRFSGYATVSAPDPGSLEAACSELEHAAGQSRVAVRRLYGQQAVAFACTLPLGRGLA